MIRPNTDPYNNPGGAIDNRFAEMYEYMKILAHHIDVIYHVSANLEPLYNVGMNIEKLLGLANFIDTLNQNELEALAEAALADDLPELTIDANGIIVPTRTFHTVDTFGNAGQDDLDTILFPIDIPNGTQLFLQLADANRHVVFRNNSGNIKTLHGDDVLVNNANQIIMLVWNDGFWTVMNV